MNRLRREDGIALVTTVVLTAIMLVMGLALLAIIDTQAGQTSKERVGESAFNLAEATLNAQAFLLGRNWPRSGTVAPCGGLTIDGNLAAPSGGSALQRQIQTMLVQSHPGQATSGSHWWVNACEEGGRDSWDSSLLDGKAYDPSTAAGPRRMWIRAEAKVGMQRRAVVALVQAGQQPIFPSNLAVVTGRFGADITTITGQVLQGPITAPLLGTLTGNSDPVVDGAVGLRCSLLDDDFLRLNCMSGVFKLTTTTPLGPLLQANEFYDFPSDTTIDAEQLAQLRQEAQASNTYYPKASATQGVVAAGDPCLPAGSAGKVVFIEQIGDGTGWCTLNAAGGKAAKALVVGAGGVLVNGGVGATYTGIIYALHRTALAGDGADIRIEGGARVVGGAYVDDNPSLPSSSRRGQVSIKPPPVSIGSLLAPVCAILPLSLVCNLDNRLAGLDVPGVDSLLGSLVPQLDPSLPAVVNDANVVNAVTTLGDSAVVTGTFRQVAPRQP